MYNPRNPATYSPQRQHGSHMAGCGCFSGNHVWGEEYDGRGEKWCICCEHFYSNESNEELAAENAIEMNETISNKKPTPKPETKSKGFSKGVIKRRG